MIGSMKVDDATDSSRTIESELEGRISTEGLQLNTRQGWPENWSFKGPDNPKTASKPLPPPAYTGQPNRLKLPPPPPPPARKPLIQNQYDEESYEPAQPPPPPPVARKPTNVSSSSTPYRPPPTSLNGTTDIKRVSCWTQTGDKRTQINYILFPDLSQLWTSVNFLVSSNGIPQEALAKYRPPPRTHEYDYETLVTKSSEIYGPYIVEFAIEAEESGRHIARGDRTHGILLYYGTSTGLHKGFGEWKQNGDLAGIRPGDPDHTAIIIDAHGNTITETDTPPYN
ncbi:hypothetical protein KEM48_000976 [Puccinia striiformis f. sp. tritici PST-130]|nr:hypothetical protein KEM48_000976 [Puccinia striiformis f. sp. tritici PST-130]